MATKPTDIEDDFSYEIEDVETPVTEEADDIEIEDDTPEEDRGRTPLPAEIVAELEADELKDYMTENVKTRMKQLKKVWHDERREKEREMREKSEALSAAQRLLDENRKLKATLASGEQELVTTYKQNVDFELGEARREYREAYEAGDTDKVIEAQEKLNSAQHRVRQVQEYRPTLQGVDTEVEREHTPAIPKPDAKTMAWQERNTWYGTDPEMTAAALGLHQKLEQANGPQYVGSEAYWDVVDATMHRRFPEYYEGEEPKTTNTKGNRETKPGNVVAPASRSTSPKKIVLRQSQISIAKKLGLTPEQYARELMKMER